MNTASCLYCGRSIILKAGLWIDPDANGDDSIWREMCDAHDTFIADHVPTLPACDMLNGCPEPVSYLDNRGFVYCAHHGQAMQSYWQPCRKLRPHELNRLARGEQVKKY